MRAKRIGIAALVCAVVAGLAVYASIFMKSQDPCFSQPNALCVLDLASNNGLPARARMLILNRLAVELKAGNATAAKEVQTEALKAAEHALKQAENHSSPGSCKALRQIYILSVIASLEAELGRTAASEDTLNRALQKAEAPTCSAGGLKQIAMVQANAGRYEIALQIAQRPG